MSKQIEMMEYKKKIADLIRQINAIKTQKEELLLSLQHLNLSHQQGKIGYLEYSHKWSEILAGKTVEEYVSSYDRRLYELAAAKKSYSAKVRTSETAEKRRDHSITLAASIMMILAIVASFAFLPQIGDITGFAVDTKTTISNATIQNYISIAMSGNLSKWGIDFQTLTPRTMNNAPKNNTGAPGGGTELYIALSADSNINADFCVKANKAMENTTAFPDGAATIPIGKMTWTNKTADDPAGPPGKANMTTAYDPDGITNLAPDNTAFYRFWMNILSDQPYGEYNNTVFFKAVQTGTGC